LQLWLDLEADPEEALPEGHSRTLGRQLLHLDDDRGAGSRDRDQGPLWRDRSGRREGAELSPILRWLLRDLLVRGGSQRSRSVRGDAHQWRLGLEVGHDV